MSAVEEPLRLPMGNLNGHLRRLWTSSCIHMYVPGAKIKEGPEMVDQHSKIETNSKDWKKAREMVGSEHRHVL